MPARLRRLSPARSLRQVTAVAAVVLAAAAGRADAQRPVTLDFEEFATPTTPEFGIPSPIVTKGFGLEATLGGVQRDFNAWGWDEGNPSYAGSTALFGNLPGTQIILFNTSGTTFNLRSMDIAPLFATSDLVPPAGSFAPFTVRFFGFLPGSGTPNFFQDFLIATPGSGTPTFTTVEFDRRWRGIEAVGWLQQSTLPPTSADPFQHQFDNIAVAVVPEPGTILLSATGLLLLAAGRAAARRRRTPA